MEEKICPLFKGECIGIKCMGCEEHTRGDTDGLIVHFEEYYTCKLFGIELDIKGNDNAPTVEPDNEYGAIQYSNGFNDGFTTAKDTIIQNIAKQYSEHNELVPEWLNIGDVGGAKK